MNYRMNKRIKLKKIEYFSSEECDILSHELISDNISGKYKTIFNQR